MDSRIWMIAGGVGLFLAGMQFMEGAISHLASRNFKLLLRRNTATNARATLSGVLVTAILQSSSIVSFITLAFAGSGIIKLQNAIAVILGANIGTTISNWIIATLGFSYNIDILWYPIIGLAGLGLVVFGEHGKTRQICHFLLGLSFLFIALGWMKQGMLDTVQRFDFAAFNSYPPFVFVIIGFVITFLIQSSTATVAITLSALYSRAIPFDLAVAIVIGSELGTSVKVVIAAAGNSPEKKRMATGSILLNLLTMIIAFAFMYPLIRFLTVSLGISDQMKGLVFFQMIINIAATLLFFPFLNPLSRKLMQYFGGNGKRSTLYIDEKLPTVPGLAQEIFRLEVFYFIKRVLAYNAAEFKLSPSEIGLDGVFTEKEWKKETEHDHLPDRYSEIKKAQGEIIEYYVRMQKRMTNPEDLSQSGQYMKAVQEAMHAAKAFKDIHHNKDELLQSGNDLKYGQFEVLSNALRQNLRMMTSMLNLTETDAILPMVKDMLDDIYKDYQALLDSIYLEADRDLLPEKDISTLQNMNRELYSAHKAMIFSICDFMLDSRSAEPLKNQSNMTN